MFYTAEKLKELDFWDSEDRHGRGSSLPSRSNLESPDFSWYDIENFKDF
jgi:hypothetical protein